MIVFSCRLKFFRVFKDFNVVGFIWGFCCICFFLGIFFVIFCLVISNLFDLMFVLFGFLELFFLFKLFVFVVGDFFFFCGDNIFCFSVD